VISAIRAWTAEMSAKTSIIEGIGESQQLREGPLG
jgi:hypothetical protein